MQQRIQVAAAMLAWSYLVALWRSDWIRSSQILVVLKRFVRAHVDAFPQLAGASYAPLRQLFSSMAVDDSIGIYDSMAVWVLQLTLSGVFPTVTVQTMPAAGVRAAGQLVAWASSIIAQRADQTAPIWTAWHIVEAAAPQDAAFHLTRWSDDYADGIDTTAAHQAVAATPNDALSRAQAESPVIPGSTTFLVPGVALNRVRSSIWPYVIGGLALLGLGAGAFVMLKKRRRGRA